MSTQRSLYCLLFMAIRFFTPSSELACASGSVLSKHVYTTYVKKSTKLNKLVDRGNSVLVIEHNLDVIKVADHIIDLGPEGGSGGGEILFEGTPEQLIKVKESFTAQFLKEELK